jgi:hypothetical protein
MEPLQLGSGSEDKSLLKKWFSRPEGKWGLVPPIAVGVALFWFWGQIVPYVLATFTGTWHLVGYLVGLTVVGFLLFDPSFRLTAFYIYASIIRSIRMTLVSTDPIGAKKTYLGQLKERLDEFNGALGKMRGFLIESERKNAESKKEYDLNFARANVCQARKDESSQRQYRLAAAQVARLDRLMAEQQKNLKRYKWAVFMLGKYYDACDEEITDVGNDIKVSEQMLREADVFKSAMRSITAILRGGPGKDMFDESTQIVEQRYTQTIGEFDQMLAMTKNLMDAKDLDDEAARAMLEQKLAEFRGSNAHLNLGTTSKTDIVDAAQHLLSPPEEALAIPSLGVPSPVGDFKDLFR